MNAIKRIALGCTVLCVTLLLTACGTPMGLTRQTAQLDLSQKSIVLASFDITRSNGRLMPDPRYVILKADKASDGKASRPFSIDEEGMEQDAAKPRKTVLVRLALEPGKHNLSQIMGTITGFMAAGTWSVPLNLDFEVPDRSVIYLGRISAHLRDRTDGEFRAGSLLPLIDQSALGISNATFDVTVSDQSAVDLPRFSDTFSALRQQPIQIRILPPFDRAALDREFSGSGTPANITTVAPGK